MSQDLRVFRVGIVTMSLCHCRQSPVLLQKQKIKTVSRINFSSNIPSIQLDIIHSESFFSLTVSGAKLFHSFHWLKRGSHENYSVFYIFPSRSGVSCFRRLHSELASLRFQWISSFHNSTETPANSGTFCELPNSIRNAYDRRFHNFLNP